jgi:hypothetical protein
MSIKLKITFTYRKHYNEINFEKKTKLKDIFVALQRKWVAL